MGLQRVMSAREQIPPQKKLNTAPDFTKGRQEAETGNTFFMPVNAMIEEGMGVKSV